MKIKKLSLANGFQVFLVPQKEATSVAVELMVKAGSKNEAVGKEGLAHFLEHMAFKGTKKWPTAQKLARVLDSVGAVYNAYTDKEKTAYWLKVAPAYLPLALEVLAQMLNQALLKEEEIEIERGVIVEEMNMYEDRPMDKVEDLFEEQLLGQNALGRSIIGRRQAILRLRRKDFLSFKKKWYRAEKMSLAIVGAVGSCSSVVQMVKRFFAALPPQAPKEPEVRVTSQQKTLFWQSKKTQQTHFMLGLPTVTLLDRRKWPARVLAAVLGGGMSSRLWLAIRERRGLAYYVYGMHQEYLPAGFLAIKAGVRNEKAKEAMELVKEELQQVKKNLRAAEVERSKKMLIGRTLIRMEESTALATLLNSGWLFEKKILSPQQIVKKLEQVSLREVRDVAAEFLCLERLRGAVIGPRS